MSTSPSARTGVERAAGTGRAVSADPSVVALWDRYKGKGETAARERLILQYAPLVKYVAGRVSVGLPPSIEHADLTSYGMFGLIDAIEKFDLDKNVKFETYAIARIKGAIIDELRSIDWIPRSVRSKARDVEQALAALEHRLQRTPTEEELAVELDVELDVLRTMLAQVSLTSLAALDETMPGEEGERQALIDTLQDHKAPNPESRLEDIELKEMLSDAITRMPEREKTVIVLYYFEGMTLSQIGEILGVTESRVCQIHTKSVLGLRAKLVERTRV